MPVTRDVLRRWTVDDLDELSADRLRYGCLDGVLQPVATPVLAEHQRISRRLFRQLDPQLPTAVELLWGCGLRLGTDWRIPDLLVVRRDAVAERLFEPADVLLAVEVVSETSRSTDRIVEPAEYAEAAYRPLLADRGGPPGGDVDEHPGRFALRRAGAVELRAGASCTLRRDGRRRRARLGLSLL